MKNLLIAMIVILFGISCQKQTSNKLSLQKYPRDVELVNDQKDNEVAARRKAPKKCPPNNPNCQPPAGTVCIFYDFDGHYISGTLWNTNGAFSVPGSGLSQFDQVIVTTDVANYYLPFPHIRVTKDSSIFLSYPESRRVRIVVTTDCNWFGFVGGMAYIGSYLWANGTPAFVCSANYNFDLPYISHAGAHEAGHTFGLRHAVDCVNGVITNPYSFFKIMGQYAQVPSIWFVGPCSLGCSVIQDDALTINTNTQ